jgi:hypothetical protein
VARSVMEPFILGVIVSCSGHLRPGRRRRADEAHPEETRRASSARRSVAARAPVTVYASALHSWRHQIGLGGLSCGKESPRRLGAGRHPRG